jgi:NAD(P)-dependent dehydrogenase (short-subunit alcohol dehydrogenase family)
MPIALITGGNRGLGLEAGKQLAARGWEVILGCRDTRKGQAAAADIPTASVRAIDVGDPASVATLASRLARDGVVLDALVNNAGISMRGFDARVAKETLRVNLDGALAVTAAVAPLVKDGGTIVNVSSQMGTLSVLSEPARTRVERAASLADIEALAAEFGDGVATGTHPQHGWPSSAYSVSKALLNAATRVLARTYAPRRIRVSSVCPGWARTDMGGSHAPRTVAIGAASIVSAVLEPRATGGFFRDGAAIAW